MNNDNPQINVFGTEDIDVFAFLNLEEMVERVIDDIFRGMISLPVEREPLSDTFPGPLLILRAPETTLAYGENARRRTAREHLWDHRIASLMSPRSP